MEPLPGESFPQRRKTPNKRNYLTTHDLSTYFKNYNQSHQFMCVLLLFQGLPVVESCSRFVQPPFSGDQQFDEHCVLWTFQQEVFRGGQKQVNVLIITLWYTQKEMADENIILKVITNFVLTWKCSYLLGIILFGLFHLFPDSCLAVHSWRNTFKRVN